MLTVGSTLFSWSLANRRSAHPRLHSLRSLLPDYSYTEWYDIKAPSFFENRNAGKTLVNRSQGLSRLIYLGILDMLIPLQRTPMTR